MMSIESKIIEQHSIHNSMSLPKVARQRAGSAPIYRDADRVPIESTSSESESSDDDRAGSDFDEFDDADFDKRTSTRSTPTSAAELVEAHQRRRPRRVRFVDAVERPRPVIIRIKLHGRHRPGRGGDTLRGTVRVQLRLALPVVGVDLHFVGAELTKKKLSKTFFSDKISLSEAVRLPATAENRGTTLLYEFSYVVPSTLPSSWPPVVSYHFVPTIRWRRGGVSPHSSGGKASDFKPQVSEKQMHMFARSVRIAQPPRTMLASIAEATASDDAVGSLSLHLPASPCDHAVYVFDSHTQSALHVASSALSAIGSFFGGGGGGGSGSSSARTSASGAVNSEHVHPFKRVELSMKLPRNVVRGGEPLRMSLNVLNHWRRHRITVQIVSVASHIHSADNLDRSQLAETTLTIVEDGVSRSVTTTATSAVVEVDECNEEEAASVGSVSSDASSLPVSFIHLPGVSTYNVASDAHDSEEPSDSFCNSRDNFDTVGVETVPYDNRRFSPSFEHVPLCACYENADLRTFNNHLCTPLTLIVELQVPTYRSGTLRHPLLAYARRSFRLDVIMDLDDGHSRLVSSVPLFVLPALNTVTRPLAAPPATRTSNDNGDGDDASDGALSPLANIEAPPSLALRSSAPPSEVNTAPCPPPLTSVTRVTHEQAERFHAERDSYVCDPLMVPLRSDEAVVERVDGVSMSAALHGDAKTGTPKATRYEHGTVLLTVENLFWARSLADATEIVRLPLQHVHSVHEDGAFLGLFGSHVVTVAAHAPPHARRSAGRGACECSGGHHNDEQGSFRFEFTAQSRGARHFAQILVHVMSVLSTNPHTSR